MLRSPKTIFCQKCSLKTTLRYKSTTRKKFALRSWNSSQKDQIYSEITSHERNYGFSSMVRKQSVKCSTGRHPPNNENRANEQVKAEDEASMWGNELGRKVSNRGKKTHGFRTWTTLGSWSNFKIWSEHPPYSPDLAPSVLKTEKVHWRMHII